MKLSTPPRRHAGDDADVIAAPSRSPSRTDGPGQSYCGHSTTSRSIRLPREGDVLTPLATATDLIADRRAGKVASRELTEMYIRRIEQHDGRLNAVVERDFERAREAARAADQGGRGALRGLPITLKESFNVAGLHTTCGVPEWRNHVSEHDAPAWTRLRAAGAVLIGKTNVPPMLADWQSANAIYGRTNNPWDLGRSPGGSSGGAGAAMAAGPSALPLGFDIRRTEPRPAPVRRRPRP